MSLSEPKHDEERINVASDISNAHADDEFGGTTERARLEKRLLRRLDLRHSILIVIYILNYIDRNNASAARLRGFQQDLKLTDTQYETLLSILYVGYILMQIPSNMLLNVIGKPSIYLPVMMMIWGTISILTGITRNFVGALLTRFFLGFVEAAFFPGALFLISKWYKRSEIGQRTALLTCGSLLSNAFGNLIASGILSGMQGSLGVAAWRWLFYIEGSLTIFVAFCAIFILPDFPSTTRWLTPLERRLAEKRLEEDVGLGDESDTGKGQKDGQSLPLAGLKMAVLDPKVWWLAFALTAMTVSLSYNQFFPTLTATLGYSRTVSLVLCAPPWIYATLEAWAVTRHSDRTGERCFHICGSLGLGIVGFIIAMSTMNIGARYLSLFLMAQTYAGFMVFLSWVSGSVPRPPAKRAVTLALVNGFSQLGNVAGAYVWPSAWGPNYRYSCAICIASSGVCILMCLMFRWHLRTLNRELEEREAAEGKAKGFRYLL